MNFGTAAEHLGKRCSLALATAGTPNGDLCRRALISAIRQLSTTPFSWNILRSDVSITANLNDYTVGGGAGQALPASTLAPRKLWYVLSTDIRELEIVSPENMIELEAGSPTSTGPAAYWTTLNNAVHVFPVPTTNWTLRGLYYRDGTLANGTQVAGVWSWPADASTSIWLDDDKGLELTILAAAAHLHRAELKRPDIADGYESELRSKLPTQTTLNRVRQLTGHVQGYI